MGRTTGISRISRVLFAVGVACAACGSVAPLEHDLVMETPVAVACSKLDRQTREIWNPERRRTVENGIVQGRPWARSVAHWVDGRLDRLVQDWQRQVETACPKETRDDDSSYSSNPKSVECLHSAGLSLQNIVELLSEANDVAVNNVAEPIYELSVQLLDCRRAFATRNGNTVEDTKESGPSSAALEKLARASVMTHFHYGDAARRPALEARHLAVAAGNARLSVDAMNTEGRALYWQERFDKAAELSAEALSVAKRAGYLQGQADAAFLASAIAGKKKDIDEALRWLNLSIDLQETATGPDHPRVAMYRDNRGDAYLYKDRLNQALEEYNAALAIRQKSDPGGISVAVSTGSIGMVYHTMGQYDEALSWFRKVLDILEPIYGKTHPSLTLPYRRIGMTHHFKGELDSALSWYQKALEIETMLGDDNSTAADLENNIGLVWVAKKNYDEALEWLERAVASEEKTAPANQLNLARYYNNIGAVYTQEGDVETALEWFEKALAIRKALLGAEHPDTVSVKESIEAVMPD